MSTGGNEDEELRLRVVYEASQVVKDAIAEITELKERVGKLDEANQLQLETLKKYDEELDKAKESLKGVSEATENLATEQKKLTQGTLEFTEVLQLQGDKERDLSTLSQEVLRRMMERQDAQAGVNRIIAETAEEAANLAAEEEKLEAITLRNAEALGEETGFKGLAGNALKAEKAMASLAGGSGLGRVGPMLESVTKAIGGPEGLGMALGAMAFGVGVLLPKLASLWTAFEEGPKDVRDAEEAIRRFDDAVKAHDDRLLKRSLTKVDKEIEELEMEQEKERDVGQKLAPEDAKRLKELRRRSKEGHEELDVGQELRKVGRTKREHAIGQAVTEALAESGGIEAMIGADPDIVSKRIVAGAIKGDERSVETLKRWSPEFAKQFAQVSPEGKKQAKLAEQLTEQGRDLENKTNRDEEARKDKEDKQREAEHKRNSAQGDQIAMAMDAYSIAEQNKADTKAQREHDKAAHEKKRLDAKTARENTNAHRMHAAVEAQHEQVAGYVGQANQQYGFARTPGQLEEVTRGAVSNVNIGMDIASAVQMAVHATQQKIQRDFMRGMQRQFSGGEMREQ